MAILIANSLNFELIKDTRDNVGRFVLVKEGSIMFLSPICPARE